MMVFIYFIFENMITQLQYSKKLVKVILRKTDLPAFFRRRQEQVYRQLDKIPVYGQPRSCHNLCRTIQFFFSYGNTQGSHMY